MPLSRGRNGRLGVAVDGPSPQQAQPALVQIAIVAGEMFDARVQQVSGPVAATIVKQNKRSIPGQVANAQRRTG